MGVREISEYSYTKVMRVSLYDSSGLFTLKVVEFCSCDVDVDNTANET